MDSYLSLENEVFTAYVFYSTVLAVKMILMSPLTGFFRMKNQAFANTEDAAMHKTVPKPNESVERVRRAHLNDLENIPVFWILALFYISTGPPLLNALICFRVFTAARYIHTFAYVVLKFTPIRGLGFMVGLCVNLYMATIILMEVGLV